MSIEINIEGCSKTYHWFCVHCGEMILLEEKDVTSRKNENGITREVLKCPNCGKEELL